jgi:hypothetical protein
VKLDARPPRLAVLDVALEVVSGEEHLARALAALPAR